MCFISPFLRGQSALLAPFPQLKFGKFGFWCQHLNGIFKKDFIGNFEYLIIISERPPNLIPLVKSQKQVPRLHKLMQIITELYLALVSWGGRDIFFKIERFKKW